MPWTPAPNPTGTWTGNCSQSDLSLATLVPTLTPTSGVYLLEGFEDNSDLTNFWSITTSGMTYSTVVRSGGVTDKYSLLVPMDGTTRSFNRTLAPWPTSSLYNRVIFKYESLSQTSSIGEAGENHAIISMRDGGVGYHSAGVNFSTVSSVMKLFASVGSTITRGTVVLSPSTWYRLILQTTGTGAAKTTVATLYLADSSTVIETITVSDTTVASPPATINWGTFTAGNMRYNLYLDDLCVRNDQSPGIGGIWLAKANFDHIVGFTPLSGTNYSNIDDFPGAYSGADYNYTSGTNIIDRFSWTWANTTPGTSLRIYHSDLQGLAITPSSSASGRLLLRTPLSNYVASTVSVGTTLTKFVSGLDSSVARNIFQAWNGLINQEAKDNFKYGYERVSGSDALRFTAVWMQFDMR